MKTRESEAEIVQNAKTVLDALTKDETFRETYNVGKDITYQLPNVLSHEDTQELSSGFREFILEAGLGDRIHRAITFELLCPLYTVTNVEDFMKAFRDIFQVLHFLWQKGIGHRDVSVGNLMCRMNDNGELICGVLNDWDLAEIGNKGNESQFRTGTRAFLAIELLGKNPPLHIERFDWESMFYALVWITSRYENGEEMPNNAPLQAWSSFQHGTARDYKITYITNPTTRPPLTSTFESLFWHWIDPLSLVFQDGIAASNAAFRARRAKPDVKLPDLETLDGSVTYCKLWDVLKRDLK